MGILVQRNHLFCAFLCRPLRNTLRMGDGVSVLLSLLSLGRHTQKSRFASHWGVSLNPVKLSYKINHHTEQQWSIYCVCTSFPHLFSLVLWNLKDTVHKRHYSPQALWGQEKVLWLPLEPIMGMTSPSQISPSTFSCASEDFRVSLAVYSSGRALSNLRNCSGSMQMRQPRLVACLVLSLPFRAGSWCSTSFHPLQ